MVLRLGNSDEADCRIALPADADATLQTAAWELQSHLRDIAGLELLIGDSRAGAPEILLGVEPSLRAEEYHLHARDNRLTISGGSSRGVLYGVYGFLRDHLGCRWFTPDCSRVPKRDAIEIGPIDERKAPAFEYRNFILNDVDDPAWCARNGYNGFNSPDDPAYGGHLTHWQYGHSLFALCKAEDYFDEHPEYFDSTSREKDVIDDHINLCFTNDDVVQIVAENMRQVMREAREAQVADPTVTQPTVFYLAQHDGGQTCGCPDCQAIIDEQGALSAPLIHFCNRVVEELGDEFPDYRMMTIAYRFSRRPPKTLKPDPRLIVQLCSIECCQSHPYATCDDPDDVKFREDMEGWQRLAEQIWVWDYLSRLWHPYLVGPGFDSLAANYRWFHEHSVRGMFTQTAGDRDFHWLNAYLMCAMMRDPYQDWKALRDEFMDAYYGAAAGPLRAFMDVVQASVVGGNHHLHYKEGAVKPFFSAEVIAAGDRLFSEAEAAVAENAAQLSRVREERMHFLCTKLQHACRDSVMNACSIEDGRYVFTRSASMTAEVEEFSAWRAERFGGDAQAFTAAGSGGSCMLHVESDLVALDNGALELEFLPRLAGRMVGLRLKDSGRNLLHMAPCEGGRFNLDNGYREEWLHAPGTYGQESASGWSAESGATAGAAEAGAGLLTQDDSAVYEQVFETGGKYMHPLQWERWTRLAEGRAQFQIESMIVNRGIEPVNSAVETYLPLDLGDVEHVELAVGDPGGRDARPPDGERMSPAAKALPHDMTLSPAVAAEGIVLSNPKLGISFRWQATGEVIHEVRIRAEAQTQRILLQVETQPLILTPGAGRRFCQVVKVDLRP